MYLLPHKSKKYRLCDRFNKWLCLYYDWCKASTSTELIKWCHSELRLPKSDIIPRQYNSLKSNEVLLYDIICWTWGWRHIISRNSELKGNFHWFFPPLSEVERFWVMCCRGCCVESKEILCNNINVLFVYKTWLQEELIRTDKDLHVFNPTQTPQEECYAWFHPLKITWEVWMDEVWA